MSSYRFETKLSYFASKGNDKTTVKDNNNESVLLVDNDSTNELLLNGNETVMAKTSQLSQEMATNCNT